MLVVGFTGGIASGKTTISEKFAQLGATIIDTDIISRELLDIAQPGYVKIRQKMGDSILLKDGNINRAKLRQIVFDDDSLKFWLESLLHPLIYQRAKREIQQNLTTGYIILVVPLLFESDFTSLVDRILVVDCPRHIQLERLLARDRIDNKLAEQMLNQQWSNKDRLDRADDVIRNDGQIDLFPLIEELHDRYSEIAKQP